MGYSFQIPVSAQIPPIFYPRLNQFQDVHLCAVEEIVFLLPYHHHKYSSLQLKMAC